MGNSIDRESREDGVILLNEFPATVPAAFLFTLAVLGGHRPCQRSESPAADPCVELACNAINNSTCDYLV